MSSWTNKFELKDGFVAWKHVVVKWLPEKSQTNKKKNRQDVGR